VDTDADTDLDDGPVALAEEKAFPFNAVFLGLFYPVICFICAGIGAASGSYWALASLVPLAGFSSMWGKSIRRGWVLTDESVTLTTDWYSYECPLGTIERATVDPRTGAVVVKTAAGEVVNYQSGRWGRNEERDRARAILTDTLRARGVLADAETLKPSIRPGVPSGVRRRAVRNLWVEIGAFPLAILTVVPAVLDGIST